VKIKLMKSDILAKEERGKLFLYFSAIEKA
jgi:hypothetical protein